MVTIPGNTKIVTQPLKGGLRLLGWGHDAGLYSIFVIGPGLSCQILRAKEEGVSLNTIYNNTNRRYKRKLLMLRSALLFY